MAPASFASAAAGNSSNTSRPEATVDWTRRTNGATQTFRRPSHATTPSGSTTQAHSRDTSGATPSNVQNPSAAYVPPHAQPGKSGNTELRYSKDQLLQLYQDKDSQSDIARLYVGTWEPNLSNGAGGSGWGRRDDQGGQSQVGVDICWDKEGSVEPLSLKDMSQEERETFSTSVNSPIKPPAQNTNKDGTPKEGLTLRKTSVSQSGGAPYGVSSPTTSRPGNRRRETNDAYPFPPSNLASPSASRFSRDESNTVAPPAALQRRRTDFKEPVAGGTTEERDKDKSAADNAGPFANLKRTTTAPFASATSTGAWTGNSPSASSAFSPMGAFGSFPASSADKKPGFSSVRGESRFKGLMSKASTEDMDKAAREKTSLGNLGKSNQAEPTKSTQSWGARPAGNDADDLSDDVPRSGSAALHGGQDASPPNSQGFATFNTPQKRDARDEGFGAFGMTANNAGLRDIFHGSEAFQHTPQHRGGGGGQEPMSPTDTNPYQSPAHERTDNEDEDSDSEQIPQQFPGMGSFQVDPTVGGSSHNNPFGGFGSIGRAPQGYEVAPSDRSQTSSVGPQRGFGPLPGLGSLPGLGTSSAWAPSQQPTIGTPVRERGLGGSDMFAPGGGEAQSPSLAGLGGSSFFERGGMGSIGRSSRLGSLLPTAMQEQMRQGENRSSTDEGSQGDRLHSLTGSFGRGAFGPQAPGAIPARDTASPLRRGMFEAFSGTHGNHDDGKRDPSDPSGAAFGSVQSSGVSQPSMFNAAPGNLGQARTSVPTSSQAHTVTSPPGQPPAPQQRQMVMPDRMRWIYRDPHGDMQGPFSGLEMHDWYKAGFFSPELLVKKFEDPEYEPLAQLIRRIGNSREPFLVPQIGIPHGPPSTQPGNAWAGTTALSGASSAAQPPFANNFPTFGTTLTAEQQNALERRKQEEQYLMARQKEHLAATQQLLAARQAQTGVGHGILPHQLHHHSSAHSLHSQPSYGSITSPGGYQPSPTQGPLPGASVPGLFDNSFRPPVVPGLAPIGPGMDMFGGINEDTTAMMTRLDLGRTGQQPLGTASLPLGPQHPESNAHVQQVVTMLGDRARIQREQTEHDKVQRAPHIEQQAAQASADRFQQFQELRVQTDMNIGTQAPPPEGVIGKPVPSAAEHKDQQEDSAPASPPSKSQPAAQPLEVSSKTEPLSLTEQVQKAASSKQTSSGQSPWAKVEPAIHPFPPPPPSQSPLPAPVGQRKPIVADNLTGESRSRSETPSVETPSASIAPWAKEPTEAPKGPSLKEIQEAEARKAAEREALAQAARREAAEKEALAQAQSPAAQPGLPSTSTWASGASPLTPVSAGQSAWAKPVAGKASGQPSVAAKKTLQQIQKEEEARKQRAVQAAAAAAATASYTASATPALSSGKRYADLASKHTPATPNAAGSSAWTTVGSGGKVKTPAAAPASPAVRAASASITPTVTKKPVVTRSTTMGAQLTKANAEEEFRKWAVGELRPDLNKGINAEDFVGSLLSFPADIELITESVHSASSTLDSRHFAEEFLRRRKLADKGLVDSTSTASPSDAKAAGGGWNEVAKKGQSTQQHQSGLDSGNFKVVAAKKKAGKR